MCVFRSAIVPLLFIVAGCEPPATTASNAPLTPSTVKALDQGWTDAQSRWFHHSANQGSNLVPYSWYVALEQQDSQTLFNADDHIQKLRFLKDAVDRDSNPDGLPVGFVKDDVVDKDGTIWLGLSCAACHTGELVYKGQTYRIEGAPAQADVQTFLTEMTTALVKTHDDDAKFDRFAKRVLNSQGTDSAARTKLRDELQKKAQFRQEFDRRNSSKQPYGYARVDAFGIIFNEVLAHALNEKDNEREPNAPVSFPFLWDTPQHDFVQWNGSAPNHPSGTQFIGPLARNVGEVLGVFGDVTVDPARADIDGFDSSARRVNLLLIEELLKKLYSPQWPDAFPKIDHDLAAKGEEIYQHNCVSCHEVLGDRTDPFRFVRAHMTPVDDVKTDPQMALNAFNRRAKSGPLKGRKKLVLIGDSISDEESGADLLVSVIGSVIIHRPLDIPTPAQLLDAEKLLGSHELANILNERIKLAHEALESGNDEVRRRVLNSLQSLYKPSRDDGKLAYKARPLNGIWATGPYLHNGSVPNLDELLKPANQRVTRFFVGSQEFDPIKVGFVSDHDPDRTRFEFRVLDDSGKPILGNSNSGHEYGVNLMPDERKALLEYLKTL